MEKKLKTRKNLSVVAVATLLMQAHLFSPDKNLRGLIFSLLFLDFSAHSLYHIIS